MCIRDRVYFQSYHIGKPDEPVKVIGTCDSEKHGTKVTFHPDPEIFEETVYDYDTLKQRLRETAFLTKGLRIVLTDTREESHHCHEFHYAGGIKEFVTYLNRSKEALYPAVSYTHLTEHFNISLDQMISKNRSNEIARPRQIAMYLCKNMTDIPLDSIGQLLGGRDHSTIIHGIKKIADEYESNENTRNLIETIKKKINPN